MVLEKEVTLTDVIECTLKMVPSIPKIIKELDEEEINSLAKYVGITVGVTVGALTEMLFYYGIYSTSTSKNPLVSAELAFFYRATFTGFCIGEFDSVKPIYLCSPGYLPGLVAKTVTELGIRCYLKE